MKQKVTITIERETENDAESLTDIVSETLKQHAEDILEPDAFIGPTGEMKYNHGVTLKWDAVFTPDPREINHETE